MSHLRHEHVRHRIRRGRRAQRAYAWLTRFDDIDTLEELQRDLEEAAADVAERIKRLRAAQADTEPVASSPGPGEEPAI